MHSIQFQTPVSCKHCRSQFVFSSQPHHIVHLFHPTHPNCSHVTSMLGPQPQQLVQLPGQLLGQALG